MPDAAVNRSMLRVRDAIDRQYADDLDLTVLAALAHLSRDHLVRTFRAVFGETPHRYLQRRRVERAMYLLRTTDRDVLEICHAVGFSSLGTFGRTFRGIVGTSPSDFRATAADLPGVPSCVVRAWSRPAAVSSIASISEKRPVPAQT